MTRMPRRVRRIVPVVLVALTLTACSGGAGEAGDAPEGQPVEVVAGGGTAADAGRALDARISGVLRDLEAGPDGVVRLGTTDGDRAVIWSVRPDGTLERTELPAQVRSVNQIATARDGTVYVSSGNGLWRADGERVVGNGEDGFTPDGAAATGPAGEISGVTVDPEGRVVYTEGLARGERLLSLVRRVEPDGTVTTLAGTPTAKLDDDEALTEALRRAADPPPGTKARDLALPGGYYTVLDAGDDGTVYVNGKESVLAIAPDGGVRAVVAGRDPDAVQVAGRPVAAEGKALDARTPLYGPAVPPNLSVAGDRIALTSWVTGTPPAAPYRWSGEYTEGQRAIIDRAFDAEKGSSSTTWPRVRLVDGGGAITTAAWSARSAAIDGEWLYLAVGDAQRGLLVGRVRLPEQLG